MRIKTIALAAMVLAGGSVLVSPASAAWSWTGTLADWAAAGGGTGTVTDGDGDMQFKLSAVNTTIPDRPAGTDYITITEVEIGSADFYDVGINWGPGGYVGGGQLAYTIQSLEGEHIKGANFDTVITGTGTTALKLLSDAQGNFLTLTSLNGARDPLAGEAMFAARGVIDVLDVFQQSATGLFQDAHNGFVVPEPGNGVLAALALGGLLLSRRRQRS